MKLFYGVEAEHIVEELGEFIQFIQDETNLIDKVDNIFIYHSLNDANYAIELFKAGDLYVSLHDLLKAEKGIKRELSFDYTLELSSGNTYVLIESLIAFQIIKGETKQIELASLQYEEHLVFELSSSEGVLFLVEKQLKDLVIKIARAYDIEVSFFDLDK